ncbi:MAG: L,D-transpeptidase family protein [Rhodobacteraceae bacterium]|nr:L,D-transpeptidase family protein [Paracoccaceae bacterium]
MAQENSGSDGIHTGDGVIGRRAALALAATAIVSGCSLFNQQAGSGPHAKGRVSHLEVHKGKRRLYALSGDRILENYRISLGFTPVGHKLREGDGKTPVGRYMIDRKNPNSRFYLSLGISYPNRDDSRAAKARGYSAGGDIFIHGQPNRSGGTLRNDWTEGCIAIANREMRKLYQMVDIGTPVYIYH